MLNHNTNQGQALMYCFSIKTFKCIVWFFSPIEYWRKFIHGWSCSNFHSSSITFREIWDIDFNKMSMIQWTLSHTSEKPTVGGYPKHLVDFHVQRHPIPSLRMHEVIRPFMINNTLFSDIAYIYTTTCLTHIFKRVPKKQGIYI